MFKTEETSKNQPFATRERGFTMLELMIVVAIVALLAVIAVPAYQDQANAARRSDGHALLTDIAARMERFYFDNTTYTRNMQELGFTAADNVAVPEPGAIGLALFGLLWVAQRPRWRWTR